MGAKVITISGPDGYIYDPDGISGEKIDYIDVYKRQVLYEADDVEDFLDGYNSLNSNKIIALARIPSIEKTSERCV